MFGIHLSLVVFVAGNAREYGVIVGVDVAIRALIPFVVVLAGVNREIFAVVVERCRLPSVLTVALGAIRGEASRGVGRIVRIVVIIPMAANAFRRRFGIIRRCVTIRALILNFYVRALNYVEIVVNSKFSRTPAGVGCVALLAIERHVQRSVIGISCRIVIFPVARGAIGWRARIAVYVALSAIYSQVRACKREVRSGVIERTFLAAVGVAGVTLRRSVNVALNAVVVFVCFCFFVLVAINAAELHVIVRVGVAIRALIPLVVVLAGINGEKL